MSLWISSRSNHWFVQHVVDICPHTFYLLPSVEKPSSNEAITEIAMTYMLPLVPDEMYWPCCTQPTVPYKIHMYHLALHALRTVTLYTNEWITTRYENITTKKIEKNINNHHSYVVAGVCCCALLFSPSSLAKMSICQVPIGNYDWLANSTQYHE